MASDQIRTYDRRESIVFLKTKEAYGGLSNMAGGFPLRVNGVRILSSEALYQACRFPHLPEVQRLIIEQRSPMTAKMKTKPYRGDSRPDWDKVRVKIMRWCLRVKLIQNWRRFGDLLLATGDKSIVEESRKDDFWGAKPINGETLTGMNVLGRLLMELREQLKSDQRDTLLCVEPLEIPDFLFMGQDIDTIAALAIENKLLSTKTETPENKPHTQSAIPASFLDQPSLFETTAQQPASASEPMTLLQEKPADKNARAQQSMITGIRSYPKMKDSGVPWLGEVPDHWVIVRLKSSINNVIQQSTERQGRDLYVALEHVESWTGRLRQAGSDVSFDSQVKRFRSGDVLFGKLRPYLAKVTLPMSDGVCVGEFLVLRPRASNTSTPYLEQLLRSKPIIDAITSSTFGAKMPRADWQFIGGMAITIPPLPEQAAIVRFLNHADRRIRRYIHTKQKLI